MDLHPTRADRRPARRWGDEHAETAALRCALGAIPVAAPAVYRLRTDASGRWCVCRDGSTDCLRFASREAATASARLAIIRCSAYRLIVQETGGAIDVESRNWPECAN